MGPTHCAECRSNSKGCFENRTQAALARLEALENGNAGLETIVVNDDDKASCDDDDVFITKKQSKGTKRKPWQAKALEAKKAPRTFLDLVHEVAVGPPNSTSCRHFCTVCGSAATYKCVRCGVHFCSGRCQNIHNDTRCLKFVA